MHQILKPRIAHWAGIALTAWLMVGAYLEFPLVLGRFYVPGIMLVLIAPVMAVLFRHDIKRSDLQFFTLFVLLSLASIAFSPGTQFLFNKLKGAAQLFFSCGLMILIFKSYKRTGGTTLYWCCVIAALGIGSGMLLEFFVPAVKAVNDQLRGRLYDAGDSGFGFGIYDNTHRDEDMVGRDRATFLTSEPSCAAEGVMIFSICCLILRQDTRTIAVFAYANFCAFLTTGSPIIPLSLLTGFAALVRFNLWRKPIILILGACILAFSFTVPRVREVLDRQIERLSLGIDEYGDLSIYSRIGVPYLRALPNVARKAPIFGVGVGGKQMLDAWSTDILAENNPEFSVGTNAFVLVFLYFGLIGGTIYYWLVYRYVKSNRIRYPILFAIVWAAYGHTGGAIEAPRFWTYTGFLVSAFWCRSQSSSQMPGRLRPPAAQKITPSVEPLAPVPS
jgi:hypothetical protein